MYLSLCTHVTLFLLMSSLSQSRIRTTTIIGNESDRLALLSFKDRVTHDPLKVMSSWNNSIHFCQWTGVSCNPSDGRVVSLNLESHKLVGSIPPSIGNLTFLSGLNLRDNYFHGEVPQEVGRLLQLQFLNLTYNSFTGQIPANLTHCSDLRVLDLVYNDIVGTIPDQLSSLTKLFYLGLGGNNLTGRIPPWIGNFSSLFALSLATNNLEGAIPDEFGQLRSLGFFQVYGNKLLGIIPHSIFNISSIYYFSVALNHLQGQLPSDIGLTLPNLKVFAGGVNNFTGYIPVSLSNISGLEILDFEINRLSGPVPISLGRLQGLTRLNFGSNQLGSGGTRDLDILTYLVNCTKLRVLGLSNNRLGGELPELIANLSTKLEIFQIGINAIHGRIPNGIHNLVNLTAFGLESNYLSGSIPIGIGRLQKLEKLYLNDNKLSGPIPSSIGNLSKLNSLYMEMNNLQGSIPSTLGNCENLILLKLSHNNLNGTIPVQFFNLSSLSISLAINHNFLTGSLPVEVGNLKNLGILSLSNNQFSGTIPSTLGNCISLEILYMNQNRFEGTLPQSLSALRGIEELDFSNNKLSGKIPDYLEKFSSLKHLNLSFNDFRGEVPKAGIFADSILGNYKLCGGVPKLHLPACLQEATPQSHSFLSPKVIVPVVVGILVVVILSFVAYFWIIKFRKRAGGTASNSKNVHLGTVSYTELFKWTGGFSIGNLIGVGSFGRVYKGVSGEDGKLVAVKVMNLQQVGAFKGFASECEALRNIRHRNLVKVISTCSSIDYEGNAFRAIIFEFMSNGSLEQRLHPEVDVGNGRLKSLNLSQRLNIAIDVASALEYLHHNCENPIAHCDIKPSNVLLDGDGIAHVSDFGLAKFLFETSNSSSENQSISLGLRGSIGYVPPEYGMGGQVSTLGDVYSYGILLLEMFTGKRPTNEMFKDGLNLHNYSVSGLPDRVMEIVDPLMFSAAVAMAEDGVEEVEARELEERALVLEVEHKMKTVGSRIEECLVAVIKIGISCSAYSPSDRTVMENVVSKLHDIRSHNKSNSVLNNNEKNKNQDMNEL